MENEVRRVAIYVRVSTIEQAREGYSIQEQIKRLKKYCEAMGWVVVKIYIDAGESGGDLKRPALKDLIKEINDYDTVLVYKLDRLSRSQKDTLYLIEDVFLANNVDFVSMTESFDTSTSFGRAMVGILAVFAQLERENIKERVAVGKQARAELGKFHGSKWVAIGYDYIDGELKINEYEKMQVLRIYEMFLAGNSITAIVKHLNNAGMKHKYGDWAHRTVKGVLKSKTYLGLLKHRDKWFDGQHTAIVSEEEWKKVNERLEERAKNLNYANTYTAALGGLCTCGHCGGRYTRRMGYRIKNTGEPKYYYTCYSRNKTSAHLVKDPNCKNKNYRKEDLEQMILNEVRKLSLDPEAIRNIRKQHDEKDFTKDIELIEKQIEDLNQQLSNLVDLFSISKMDMSIVEAKTSKIQDEKSRLQLQLEQYQNTEEKQSIEEVHELITSLSPMLDSGDDDQIRAALHQLISDIVIDNDDVTIHWKFV